MLLIAEPTVDRFVPASPPRNGYGATVASDGAHDRPLDYLTPLAAAQETTSESAVSGLVAGAAVSTAKQLLLHPVDTVKVCSLLRYGRGVLASVTVIFIT